MVGCVEKTMSLSMARNASALILVGIVARGTYLIDARFTILLMPPFLLYYTQANPGWYNELPVVRYLSNLAANVESTFGEWGFRGFMIIAGLLAGFLVNKAF